MQNQLQIYVTYFAKAFYSTQILVSQELWKFSQIGMLIHIYLVLVTVYTKSSLVGFKWSINFFLKLKNFIKEEELMEANSKVNIQHCQVKHKFRLLDIKPCYLLHLQPVAPRPCLQQLRAAHMYHQTLHSPKLEQKKKSKIFKCWLLSIWYGW